MTTTTETWLDVIPALPLARGVPVVDRPTEWRGVAAAQNHRIVITFDNVEG